MKPVKKNISFAWICPLVIFMIAALSMQAYGWHVETCGNEPINEINYRDWPGIMPVINHTTRVRHTWTNGNEHFYYRGDTEALNDALQKFAKLAVDVREVILLPKPTDYNMPCNWLLHIQGGVSRHDEKETNVFDKYPTLSVYVDNNSIDPARIRVPKGVVLTELVDLRQRYLQGLASTDPTVRGYAADFLAGVDSWNNQSASPIAALIEDKDDWVRAMAASSLIRFGRNAEPALPILRRLVQDSDERTRERLREAISKIENAKDKTAPEEKRQFSDTLEKIRKFVLIHGRSSPSTESKEKSASSKKQ
jgi:hypothetical protein